MSARIELMIKGAWHRLDQYADLGGADLLFTGPNQEPEWLRVIRYDPDHQQLFCLGGKLLSASKVWQGILDGRVIVKSLAIPPF